MSVRYVSIRRAAKRILYKLHEKTRAAQKHSKMRLGETMSEETEKIFAEALRFLITSTPSERDLPAGVVAKRVEIYEKLTDIIEPIEAK